MQEETEVINLGKIPSSILVKLKIDNGITELIILKIKYLAKHIKKHYINITDKELEFKVRHIIKNVTYIAHNISERSLLYISISNNSEMVVFRMPENSSSAYATTVYPTTFNKINSYYKNKNIIIMQVNKK